MKPHVKEAFNIISQATGLLSGTRNDHIRISQALKVLEQELTPKEPAKQEQKSV